MQKPHEYMTYKKSRYVKRQALHYIGVGAFFAVDLVCQKVKSIAQKAVSLVKVERPAVMSTKTTPQV